MNFEEIVENCVAYAADFVQPELSVRYFQELKERIQWKQEQIKFGKTDINLPRLTSWIGDPGAKYFYSGIHNEPVTWFEPLSALRKQCDNLFPNHPVNSVLCNYYRTGADSIGYHSDNERDLVDNSTIITVSLGGPRTFYLKSRDGKGEIRKLSLENGSVLLMYGDCQKRWLHCIPKEPELNEPRISLTFRTVRIKL